MTRIAIPVNDLKRYAALVAEPLAACAAEVLRSGHYVLGPAVREFEARFAEYCGTAHCVGVANGTDALELALRAVGVKQGDRVLVAANAAMYGTTAVLAIDAEPVFADVDPASGLLTVETISRAIASSTPPKAIIVTHLYGRLAAMGAIVDLARANGIAVVEDCAQAHGAVGPDGRKAGAYGDIATFSFYPTKNLGALGDGGAVVCHDDALATSVRQLRQYGWTSKYNNVVGGGRNSRLDEIQAAFLTQLLPDLERRNQRRRAIANRYSSEIRHARIRTAPVAGPEFVAHLYVVQCAMRDQLAAHLESLAIGSERHYPTPDYRQPVHGTRFAAVDLPVTETWCRDALTLPCFPEMTDQEVDAVITACNTWQP
jgi:dTDP-4-amino-4,6-dideoxygalactose transaminase